MEPSPQRDEAPLVLHGVRVLVVEDDFILLMELQAILLDAGAEIVGLCRNVKDALALADRERLTAAVLDIRLGTETVAPVAQRLAERGAPFVFYTGQDSDPILAEWPDCKIVAKPASPRAIVAAVAGLLK